VRVRPGASVPGPGGPAGGDKLEGKTKTPRGRPARPRKGPRPAERPEPPGAAEMAAAAARAADGRKAEDILVLDLRGRSQCADYFVIVTGKVEAQLTAIVRAVQESLAALGARALGLGESAGLGGWSLLDYGPVVVHAFVPEVRNYYDLELLWGDAPRLKWWEDSAQPPATAPAEAGGTGPVPPAGAAPAAPEA